jgi:hypothetical protein
MKVYDTYRDVMVTVHRNPTRSDAETLFRRYPGGIRGLIDRRGLWMWDAELLHDTVAGEIGTQPETLYLYLLPGLVQIKGEDYFDARSEIVTGFDQPLRAIFSDRVPYNPDNGEYM